MIRKDSAETPQQPSTPSDAQAGAAEVPVLPPQAPIEVASGGTGTVNDPSGSDTKPPGVADLDLLA
jgi:hypothetical protein